MANLKISIVTPSYNQGQYLEQAILSVINQNYDNYEYFIMDGGSNDTSLDTIKKYESYLTYWQTTKDGGQADAINKGWERCSGDLIAWLNSDDYYEANCFNHVSDLFNENPNASIIYGNCSVVSRNGEYLDSKLPKDITLQKMLEGYSLPQPSVFLHKKVLQDIGLLNSDHKFCLDWAYFLKLFHRYERRGEAIYLNEFLSCSREYFGTKSTTGQQSKAKERLQFLDSEIRHWDIVTAGMYYKAKSSIYRVSAIDSFLNSRYIPSLLPFIKAFFFAPIFTLRRMKGLKWLFKKLFECKRTY